MKRTAVEIALARQLARIVDGDIAEVACRARISVRQLRYMRAGKYLDVRLSTLSRLAEAMGISVVIGTAPRARKPAPIGHRRGKPRTMRREPNGVERVTFDEDKQDSEED